MSAQGLCAICAYPTESFVWMRPVIAEDRRRQKMFFCDELCHEVGIPHLEAEGFEEAVGLLGWDIFISMWRRQT